MSHDLNHTCGTCNYWTGDKAKRSGNGECHRLPPAAAGIIQTRHHMTGETQPAIMSGFPSVSAANWCGEYQPELLV